jgi:hypothetical protein
MRAERTIVRLGIPALLLASCAGATAVSWHATASQIPSFAFGSHVVLAVQIALLFFYAGLLLLVPPLRALFGGALPVELSLRGARWADEFPDLGDDLVARQAKAEETALRGDGDRKEEIQLLRQELREGDLALEAFADQAVKRMTAIEEKVRSRGCRD